MVSETVRATDIKLTIAIQFIKKKAREKKNNLTVKSMDEFDLLYFFDKSWDVRK